MANKRSLLKSSSIDITENISVMIPTVDEILEDENFYYDIISTITASPFQYMVQLDDIGIDFTTMSDYDLFLMMFNTYSNKDLSLVFGNLDVTDLKVTEYHEGKFALMNADRTIVIDELVYNDITNAIRNIHMLEKNKFKPGNEHSRKYLIDKERKKQKKKKKNNNNEPYLEKLIISLVNTNEFPYTYNTCMDLSIYQFNQSFKQIQHKINFDTTMIGVYAGTVDTSKMTNKDSLSWIQLNNSKN